MSFFGIEVAAGEPAYYRPDQDCPGVRIKKATLTVDGGDGTAVTAGEATRVLIKCRVEKGARRRSFARLPSFPFLPLLSLRERG
jgi:hypothetical protein